MSYAPNPQINCLEAVYATLRRKALRVTKPRIAMIYALSSATRPISAEQVHAAMKGVCDLVTVYRSIGQLVDVGIVRKHFAFDGIILYSLMGVSSTYTVMACDGSFGGAVPDNLAASLDDCIGKVVKELTALGYKGVKPVVQFFVDPAGGSAITT